MQLSSTVQWFQTSFLPHSNCHNSWAKFSHIYPFLAFYLSFFHNISHWRSMRMAGNWGSRPHFPTIFIYVHPHFHICSYIFPKFPNLLPWPFPSHHGSTPAPPRRHGIAMVSTQRVVDHPLLLTLRAVPGTQGTCEAGLSWGPKAELVRETENLWETSLGYPEKLGICFIWCRIWVLWGMYIPRINGLVLLGKAQLVGGWPTPLKNMKVSRDDYSQYVKSISQWSGLAGKILTRKPHIQWENP